MTDTTAVTPVATTAAPTSKRSPSELTPREIVAELDRYIVGQDDAKRMVSIALRNRWRRQQLADDIRDEVSPKNIIMIGPTGVGKTEIARRLARLAGAPFIKVEASKYTEVGYVGRDVESMVRDLMEVGIALVRKDMEAQIADTLASVVEERLLDLLLPQPLAVADDGERTQRTRDKIRERLRRGDMEDSQVEVEITESMQIPVMTVSGQGMEGMDSGGLEDFLGKLMPKNTKRRKVKVSEARDILSAQEAQNLIDEDDLVAQAKQRVENNGIIFIDEIDKIAVREGGMRGGEVSREGVQRDILPIVEGSTIATKHGPVDTKHVLFIAAGAFHMAKPTDLIPELQGRFPIRVELSPLGAEDFERILSEPAASLTKQYVAMLATEGVTLDFQQDGIHAIAMAAAQVNENTENIGARRLHTILERVLEEVLFHGPDMDGANVAVDAPMVEQRLRDVIEDRDLSHYIL